MDIARARFVVSERGRAALDGLPPELADLVPTRLADLLRKTFPPDEASALAEQLTLGAKARERFGGDPGFAYSREGLEMMTHPLVARRRAGRLAALDLPVLDLTCGIGGDLRACLDAGIRAGGIDRDEATVLLAANNCDGRVARGDALQPPFDICAGTVILDPARRSAAGRRFNPAAFVPSWDAALRLLGDAQAGVLKAPPGIDHAYVPPKAEMEFVQLGRTMREASIWTGRDTEPGLRRAVLLPAGVELTSQDAEGRAGTCPVGSYMFDPESCVTRAGLVRQLAARLDAQQLDEHVAYLTSDQRSFDPLAATFEVLDVLPFGVSALRKRLRDRGWVPDEIRRRAFPIEPDELRRLLGRGEGDRVALLCTTIGTRRTVIIGRRIREDGELRTGVDNNPS